MNKHRLVSSYFLTLNWCISCLNHTELIFTPTKLCSPLTATTLESYLDTIRKCFVDLYGRPKKCKEIWDLKLSRQSFPVHLLLYKTSFIFRKKTLLSHCQIAWLQTNAVSLQSLTAETAASRSPVAQSDGSE